MILQPVLSWWILALSFLPLVVCGGWGLWQQRRRPHQRRRWLRRLLMVLLLVIISLRPAIPATSRAAGSALLDVYFLIDTTLSISAEDYQDNKPRLEGVRQDVAAIAAQLAGARYSVISFDNQARQLLPLTHDTTTLTTTVQTIAIQEPLYATGSSIDSGLELLKQELERSKAAAPERGRIVFYMGDGEQTADRAPAAFTPIKPLIKGGAVLGYGSTNGGKMPDRSTSLIGSKNQPYILDYGSSDWPTPAALSRIDETALRTIANDAGLNYLHRTQPTDGRDIIADIQVNRIIAASRDTETYHDLYWILTPALLLLLSLEARLLWRHAGRSPARTGGAS